jgi:hypothetical protein
VAKVRSGGIILFIISLPLLIGLVFYGPFVADLFLHRRPPSRFLIPSGYVGWVKIEYAVPDAQPLPREGKYLIVRLGKDGSAQTSSSVPDGWSYDQFFYDSGNARRPLSNAGWCKGGMIWGEVTTNEKKVKIQKFFVGTEDQFRMEVDPAGKTYSPCG